MQALMNIWKQRKSDARLQLKKNYYFNIAESKRRGTSKEEDGEDALALKAEDGRGDRRNVQGELHASIEP